MAKYVIDESTLTDIGDAIREQLGTTEKINTSNMGNQIRSINTSGVTIKYHLDITESASHLFYYYGGTLLPSYATYDLTENVTDTSSMFEHCENLTEIPLLNTSNVTNMQYMFRFCEKINDIPLLNTENVTNMSGMFWNCKKMTKLPEINTDNVTNMEYMVFGCSSLNEVKINTDNVTNMNSMFQYCYRLAVIDITSMDKITTSYKSSYMAYCCHSLKKFIIRNMTKVPVLGTNAFGDCYHFTGTVSEAYNPNGLKDGAIYVPDAYVDQLKITSGWMNYADLIKPLSELYE